jgi:hypothetical protein
MPRPQSFEDILSRLPGAKQSGDSWTAPCPLSGHKTPAGHVTLRDARDKALITCQGGKHSYQDYCQAWGFDSLTYSDNGIGGDTTIGQGRYSVIPSPKSGNLASKMGTVTPLTDDDTPPCTTDPHESAIGLPVAEAIEIWRSEGASVIHLGPGENCFDLSKLLSRPDLPERHSEAVKAWLQQHKGGKEQC